MSYKNRWVVAATPEQMRSSQAVVSISNELGVTLPTAQLLVNRGCVTPSDAKSFLGKEEEQLHDPFLLLDIDNAAYRILEAVENNEKIVIFGDYDVDGVTSVCCLYLYLKNAGADVSYYIPCRTGEGYGMSDAAVRKIAADGCSLIVTVDTGITACDEAETLRELGVDLVITDHHECRYDENGNVMIPDAEAVVNPRRPDCTYPFKELAGVGVVFKLICALESISCPGDSMLECVRRISKDYCDLTAIGTIADVMPINDENRLIVSYGLKLIENGGRPGIMELIDASSGETKYGAKKKITASYIGFTIAPRINAAGRISDASVAVQLFLSPDRESAAPIAAKLCDLNRERQNEENKIVEQAYARIAASQDFKTDPVVVLDDESWHHGIIGIVASRITEKYNCPSILISFDGNENGGIPGDEDIGKGSGRSVKGMNLVDALSDCSDLLEKSGGHELAAGLTIKRKNLTEFKRRLNERAREMLGDTERVTSLEAECELNEADITMRQVSELYYLEPYGTSNPVPVFVIRRLPVIDCAEVGGGKHTRVTLKLGESTICAMCFRMTLRELDLFPGDLVDVMFSLDVNEFQGTRSLQMIVKDIRLTESRMKKEEGAVNMYVRIRQGENPAAVTSGVYNVGDIVPVRSEFACVYNMLRRELRLEHEIFSIRALIHMLRKEGASIGYIKLKYILAVFSELELLSVKKLDGDNEIFAFGYLKQTVKRDLESSKIYAKLRRSFGMM